MDSISSEIPREVSDILVDLDVIGNIPTMHKFNTKTGTYANANSWSDAGWRTWYGEDCDGTIDHINSKITTAIAVARKYPIWTKIICERVINMGGALTNLKHVYSMNPKNVEKIPKFDLIRLRIDPTALANACSQKSTVKPATEPVTEPIPIPKTDVPMSPPIQRTSLGFNGLSPLIGRTSFGHHTGGLTVNSDLKKSRSMNDLPQEEKRGEASLANVD